MFHSIIPKTKERWEEVVIPIKDSELSALLYERWVKQRAADVEKWSNGKLGYVHIKSMGDDSFRSIYSDILGGNTIIVKGLSSTHVSTEAVACTKI